MLEILDRAVGFSSERSRALWWYVYDGAHWRCDTRYGCKRTSYPGFQFMFMVAGRGTGGYQGKPWAAKKGDAVLMDLRQPHWYWADASDPAAIRESATIAVLSFMCRISTFDTTASVPLEKAAGPVVRDSDA